MLQFTFVLGYTGARAAEAPEPFSLLAGMLTTLQERSDIDPIINSLDEVLNGRAATYEWDLTTSTVHVMRDRFQLYYNEGRDPFKRRSAPDSVNDPNASAPENVSGRELVCEGETGELRALLEQWCDFVPS